MNEPIPSTRATDRRQQGRGVLCAKCEHLNPLDVERCEYCQGHLFVVCKDCEHKNPRVLAKCGKCGRSLHRTLGDRVKQGSGGRPTNLVYAAITVIALLAAIFAIVQNAGVRLW
jgi:ribosomal protein L40E